MKRLPDRKWKLAVALLALAAAFVVFWPLPDPPPPPPAPESSDTPQYEPGPMLDYMVQGGDTVESISRLFVVLESNLRRANHLGPYEELEPGQAIVIPPQMTE